MISLISSSLETINLVVPDPSTFLWMAASVGYAAAVNSNSIKMLLANSFSQFPIKGNPVFSNRPNSLPKKPPDSPIFSSWVMDNFILADQPLVKGLQSLETWCIS